MHPNGIGDACDDPDGDGVFDLRDNCADVGNSDQGNADGDRFGEVCDLYPDAALEIRTEELSFALTGQPLRVQYRLQDRRDGRLLGELSGARATLTLSGSAVFGSAALEGRLLSGAGTNRALVEFEQGLATLEILAPIDERVRLASEDSEQLDLRLATNVFEDFEAGDGGFTHRGENDRWERGIPTAGPRAAVSGLRVFSTNLSGSNAATTDSQLLSPAYHLPVGSTPYLELQSWLDLSYYSGRAEVEITSDGGASFSTLAKYESFFPRGYSSLRYWLGNYAGRSIRVRLRFTSSSFRAPDWYIDDFSLTGIGRSLDVLTPDGDADSDGLTNARELALGTQPRVADSDSDGSIDGSDNCLLIPNYGQADAVHLNGIGDACDDPDADGVYDHLDNCADLENPGQEDRVHVNRIGDACDDPDVDGAADAVDNCVDSSNPDQSDRDSDGDGDACDLCAEIYDPAQRHQLACVEVSTAEGRCLAAELTPLVPLGPGELRISRLELRRPEKLRFEVLGDGCSESDSVDIALNGVPLESLELEGPRCFCTAPRIVEVVDPALIERAWSLRGPNHFEVRKTGTRSTFAWVRVAVIGEHTSETHCLLDARGQGCTGSAYSCGFGEFSGTHSLVDPLAERIPIRSVPFGSGTLPGSFDVSMLPAGDAELCVRGDRGPALFGASSGGELVLLDPPRGPGRVVGRVGFSVHEIEYDDRSGRAVALLADPTAVGSSLYEFDLETGAELGRVSVPDARLTALEYIDGTLYGVAREGAFGSSLYTVSLETGTSVRIGSIGPQSITGLAYDTARDLLYALTSGPGLGSALLRIDRSTGAASEVARVWIPVNSLEFGPGGVLYAAGDEPFGGGNLYRLDAETGASEWLGPTPSYLTGLALSPTRIAEDCSRFSALGQEGIALNGAACVEVDIEPGSRRNRIDPRSRGKIGVAILGSPELDAHDIDPSSLAFGPASAHRRGSLRFRDTNRDRRRDLVAEFRIRKTGISAGDSRACLVGTVRSGSSFESCDGISTRRERDDEERDEDNDRRGD